MIINQMAVFGMTLIDGNVLLFITSAILAIGTLLFWCFQIRAQPGKRVMAQSTEATTQKTPAAAASGVHQQELRQLCQLRLRLLGPATAPRPPTSDPVPHNEPLELVWVAPTGKRWHRKKDCKGFEGAHKVEQVPLTQVGKRTPCKLRAR